MNSFLSVLAAGITGNARLHEKLESSEAARVIDRCLKRILRSIEVGGGNVVQTGGGEVMAAFGAVEDVVNTAIEMQRRVADLPPVSGVKMTIRVGISCGVTARAGQSAEDGLAREAAHVAGIAKGGQILALGRICQALPEAMQAFPTDTGSTLLGESGRKETIVEIKSGTAPTGSPPAPDAAPAADSCLRLNYGKAVIVLDEKKPVIDMGRDGSCDVVIRDPRASRRHATINRKGNQVVLIDKSANGPFVTFDGDSERFVKHAELALHGKGVISFAASSVEPDADCASFECI
ncbi:MAG: FHA domain-containing protein [Candidatus Accumulibacter sp.]|nr:FHA domain-containing protein [Accumulibacter sp.]